MDELIITIRALHNEHKVIKKRIEELHEDQEETNKILQKWLKDYAAELVEFKKELKEMKKAIKGRTF